MPNQNATPRIARTIAIHALLSFVAGVVAPLAGYLLSLGREYSMVSQVVWFALFNAQTALLQIYAAFGPAALLKRLPVLTVGIAVSVIGSVWWAWLPRWLFLPSSRGDGLLYWFLASRMTIHIGLSSVALFCLRSRVGVIRQATPLVKSESKRLSLRELFFLTTVAAIAAGLVRLIALMTLLSVLTKAATLTGLVFAAFSTKYRWAGVLLGIVAMTLGNSLTLFSITNLGGPRAYSLMMQLVSIDTLSLAIAYATHRPLRRAGYRLTKP